MKNYHYKHDHRIATIINNSGISGSFNATRNEPARKQKMLPSMLALLIGLGLTTTAFGDAFQQKILNNFGNPELARLFLKNTDPSSAVDTTADAIIGGVPATARRNSRYVLVELGTLGGSESFADAINNLGQVVGTADTAGDQSRDPFLYEKGKMINIGGKFLLPVADGEINGAGQVTGEALSTKGISSPAILDTRTMRTTILGSFGGIAFDNFNGQALSINKFGQAVGYSYLKNGDRHAFLYDKGKFKDLGSFGGYSVANAINNKGTVVGFSSNLINGVPHAFIYANGKMRDISPLRDFNFTGLIQSDARDINTAGQVVGTFNTNDGTFGFIYSGGISTQFGLAGSPETDPLDINDRGDVVGVMSVPFEAACLDPDTKKEISCIKYRDHGFIYSKGQVEDLNDLIPANSGMEITWANSINNSGQIVGYGKKDGIFKAYMLRPRTLVNNLN